MKLLAWDTSSKSGALVALDGARLVSEWTLNVDATHSEQLLWGVHQLLQAARWKLEEVDVFGVGVGPGSFTGLRIGITTARTLAHTLNKPLIGVSSLAALARPAALALGRASEPVTLIAATDACKGELFALWGNSKSVRDCVAMADGDFPGLWKRGVREEVIRPEDLVKEVARKKSKWAVVGEGRRRYPEVWKKLPAKQELDLTDSAYPDQVQGRFLGQLVWEAYQVGLARESLLVHPRYVRVADAERKLKAGLLKPQPSSPSSQ